MCRKIFYNLILFGLARQHSF